VSDVDLEGLDLDHRVPRWAMPLTVLGVVSCWVLLLAVLGGPSWGDAGEWLTSSFAVRAGALHCLYPPLTSAPSGSPQPGPWIAPLWPLLDGGLQALGQVVSLGHSTPIPARSSSAFSAGCSTTVVALSTWANRARAIPEALWLGALALLPLLCGVVAWCRAARRGGQRAEVVALLLIGLSPAIFEAVSSVAHPQDLVTLGLGLLAAALVLRSRVFAAGLAVALAVFTQQSALLVGIALLAILPWRAAWRFGLAAGGAAAVGLLALLLTTSSSALRAVLVGSGATPSAGGTWLQLVGGSAAWVTIAARGLPLVVAAAVAVAVRSHRRGASLEAVPLAAVVATALLARLVFEVNFFGYYLAGVTAALVALEVALGILRSITWCWLVLVLVSFDPIATSPWPSWADAPAGKVLAPLAFVGLGVAAVVEWRRHHRLGPPALAATVVAMSILVAAPWSTPVGVRPWWWTGCAQVLLCGWAAFAIAQGITPWWRRTTDSTTALVRSQP